MRETATKSNAAAPTAVLSGLAHRPDFTTSAERDKATSDVAAFDRDRSTHPARVASSVPLALPPTIRTLTPAPIAPQFKLKVNTPGDEYEQEADRIADMVMRMPEPPVQMKWRCAENENQCPDCKKRKEESVQRKASSTTVTEAPASVHKVISSPGQTLDAPTRGYFEPRLGWDLSRVRIHTDAAAGRSANALGASAYTVGNHIAFAPGAFVRGPTRLLAHELVHVGQQTTASAPTHAQRFVGAGFVGKQLLESWNGLDSEEKAGWIDRAMDAAISLLDILPPLPQLGVLWPIVKAGMMGALEQVRTAAVEIKVAAVDRIAAILLGADSDFQLSLVTGVIKGFFVDGLWGTVEGIVSVVKAIPQVWEFFSRIDEMIDGIPEELEAILDEARSLGHQLADGLVEALTAGQSFLSDPVAAWKTLQEVVAGVLAMAKQVGGAMASALLEFFAKPGSSEQMGTALGRLVGGMLFGRLLDYVTAGLGSTVAKAGQFLAELVSQIAKSVLAAIRTLMTHLRSFTGAAEQLFDSARLKFFEPIKKLFGRMLARLEQAGERFLSNCHESKLECRLPGKKRRSRQRSERPQTDAGKKADDVSQSAGSHTPENSTSREPHAKRRQGGTATGALYENPSNVVTSRVDELKAAIPEAQSGRVTMAVAVVEDSNGVRSLLVATSEPRGYLRKGVELKNGESMVTGTRHAEADIIHHAQANKLKVVDIGATRPVCVGCQNVIGRTEANISTPVKPRPKSKPREIREPTRIGRRRRRL